MKKQEETQTQHDMEHDYFSRLMFGNKYERQREQKDPYAHNDYSESKESYPQERLNILKTLENVDLLKLIENIDTLVDSAKKLKPLIQQIQPIMKNFLKK